MARISKPLRVRQESLIAILITIWIVLPMVIHMMPPRSEILYTLAYSMLAWVAFTCWLRVRHHGLTLWSEFADIGIWITGVFGVGYTLAFFNEIYRALTA